MTEVVVDEELLSTMELDLVRSVMVAAAEGRRSNARSKTRREIARLLTQQNAAGASVEGNSKERQA